MALLIHSPEFFAVKIFTNPNCNANKALKSLAVFRNDDDKAVSRFRVRARARADFEKCEVRVSELDHLYGQFSAPVKQEMKTQSKDEDEKQDYYVNMGYAIRTVREEFPALFFREPSFDIYREDIVFKDPLNTFHGIENYKSIYWALRFHGRIFFKALWVEIISVWQPMENVIMVRWTVHGIPRVPWESRGRFDGTSEYKFDRHGKIYQHRVDNVALNSPSKFRVLAVEELIQAIGCPSTPKPTCFEVSSQHLKRK